MSLGHGAMWTMAALMPPACAELVSQTGLWCSQVSESRARCLQEECSCWHLRGLSRSHPSSEAADVVVVQELGGSRAGNVALCSGRLLFCCLLFDYFLAFFCVFLLTLLFSEMKYLVSNCSQIVIIVCRQMAHSLWSSNHMRETAALSCVYKYWC